MPLKKTLVIGGTGKTGRRVAARLLTRGLPVRIGSRTGAVPFDWNKPDTWPRALTDVESAYVSYYPDLAVPGAADAIQSFSNLAVSVGVTRLVLLSGRGETEAQHCEEIVRDASAESTIVRASWFSQNFSEGYLLDPILSGEVALPVGNVGEPFVDADDIADVVVAALTEDRHAGQLYEVTGPRLWTFPEAVAEIATATGRHIRFVNVAVDDYASALEHAHLPREFVTLITYLFTQVLDGRNASVQDGVRQALGRPACDFGRYARATAASGVWSFGDSASSTTPGRASEGVR